MYRSRFSLIFIFCLLVSCVAKGEVGSNQEKTLFQQQALHEQNRLRALHHAPALSWDATLAAYAENHALNCRFKHSHGQYGENLAAGHANITKAIDAWYQEKHLYSYAHPGFAAQTGHFTQLVWIASTKVGCGFAVCNGKGGTPGKYYVCEYSPPGNVVNPGYFEANVR